MPETLFDELKRYVHWSTADEDALRSLHAAAAPRFTGIVNVFYDTILAHEEARRSLTGGETRVGQLKSTLCAWMDRLLRGPWDEEYFESRARIGSRHVRIGLPQHYMFGAMNVIRRELNAVVDEAFLRDPDALARTRAALGRILDLELAIMLHTYREDLVAQAARSERLATYGQLVASIGHDLRNPLGVIESSVFIMRGRVGPDERVRKHLDRISDQLAIANGIITNLLEIVRNKPVTREPVLLDPLITDAAASVGRPAGVAFASEGLSGLEVGGDPIALRQVVVNLMTNAVEAASPNGQVTVRGARTGEQVVISVEDTGPGVDASILPRLFEPLITTKTHGTGLGLALVKRIVERHGGTVRYDRREGGGARFTVLLPA